MKVNIQQILLWGLLPLLNFLIWMYFGQTWSNSFREIRSKTCKNTLDKLLRESYGDYLLAVHIIYTN